MLFSPPMPQAVLPPAKAMALHKCCLASKARGQESRHFPAHAELLCFAFLYSWQNIDPLSKAMPGKTHHRMSDIKGRIFILTVRNGYMHDDKIFTAQC